MPACGCSKNLSISQVDNAYWLWTFQGKILQKHTPEKFCQLLWRPRPPSLLDPKQVKEVKKNLKKYSKKFDHEDSIKSSVESKVCDGEQKKTTFMDFPWAWNSFEFMLDLLL